MATLKDQFDELQVTSAFNALDDDYLDSEDDDAHTVIYDQPSNKLQELTDLQRIAQAPAVPDIGYEGQPIQTYSVEIDNHPIAQCAIEAYATDGVFKLGPKDIWYVFRSVLPANYHANLEQLESYSTHVTVVNKNLSVVGDAETYQELQDIIHRAVLPPEKIYGEQPADCITYAVAYYCHNILIPIIKEIQRMVECSISGTTYEDTAYKEAAIFYDNSPVGHCTSGWIFDLAPRKPLPRTGVYLTGNRILVHSGMINDAIQTQPFNYSASYAASKAMYYYMGRNTIYKNGSMYRLLD